MVRLYGKAPGCLHRYSFQLARTSRREVPAVQHISCIPSTLGEFGADCQLALRVNSAASTPNLFGPNSFQCLEQSTHSSGHVSVWSNHRQEVSEPRRGLADF